MLKKIISSLGYLAMMLSLGFVIYYYVLNPNSPLKNINSDFSGLSTKPLFAAKFPNENGVIQDLNQYKGKIIVLNFWATWCPPCRDEMPEFSKLHQQYQHQNVVVLGAAADELAAVRHYLAASPVSYPIIVGDMDAMSLSSHLGNVQGALPFTVFINTDGIVAHVHLGRISYAQLEKELNRILPSKN